MQLSTSARESCSKRSKQLATSTLTTTSSNSPFRYSISSSTMATTTWSTLASAVFTNLSKSTRNAFKDGRWCLSSALTHPISPSLKKLSDCSYSSPIRKTQSIFSIRLSFWPKNPPKRLRKGIWSKMDSSSSKGSQMIDRFFWEGWIKSSISSSIWSAMVASTTSCELCSR